MSTWWAFFHLVKKVFLKSASEPVNNCRKAFLLTLEAKHLLKCFLESGPHVLTPETEILILHLQELMLQEVVTVMFKNELRLLQISHICYRNKEQIQGCFGPSMQYWVKLHEKSLQGA